MRQSEGEEEKKLSEKKLRILFFSVKKELNISIIFLDTSYVPSFLDYREITDTPPFFFKLIN